MDRDMLTRIVRMTLRMIFVLANNLYCIPTYSFWMFLFLPLLYWKPELYWHIEGKLFHWLLSMVSAWSWSAGYTIEELGDDISSCYNQECLLVVNHQSTADVPILMAAFQPKGNVISNMMWLMDRLFKYTNFGLVSLIHGDFFIQSGKNIRESQLKNLRDHFLNVYALRHRKWLLLFPEGGFLRKRKETSQRYAKKNNLPNLEHVSLPRLGAMHVAVTTLNPIQQSDSNHQNSLNSEHPVCKDSYDNFTFSPDKDNFGKKSEPLKWVIDVTIGYQNQNPLSLLAICTSSRPPCITTIYYRRYPIEEVPVNITDLTHWLYDRWIEKESMLKEFYETGKFPILPSPHSKVLEKPVPVTLNNTWLICLHIFFISSTLFHYYILSSFFKLVWGLTRP